MIQTPLVFVYCNWKYVHVVFRCMSTMVFGRFAIYKSDIDVCTISCNKGFPSQVLLKSCLCFLLAMLHWRQALQSVGQTQAVLWSQVSQIWIEDHTCGKLYHHNPGVFSHKAYKFDLNITWHIFGQETNNSNTPSSFNYCFLDMTLKGEFRI